ncbi:MAG: hypothetical protein P4L81_01215 [Candidatus Pacebacteria bacterium]|nr:hypothetical protein [Candidatus Paceibacterota bacterium]
MIFEVKLRRKLRAWLGTRPVISTTSQAAVRQFPWLIDLVPLRSRIECEEHMVQYLDDPLIKKITQVNQPCVDRHIQCAYLVTATGKVAGDVRARLRPDRSYHFPLTWSDIFGAVIETPEVVQYVVAVDTSKSFTRLHVFIMPENVKPRELARKCLRVTIADAWTSDTRAVVSTRLRSQASRI